MLWAAFLCLICFLWIHSVMISRCREMFYVTEIELEGVLCLSAQHEGISSGGNDDNRRENGQRKRDNRLAVP